MAKTSQEIELRERLRLKIIELGLEYDYFTDFPSLSDIDLAEALGVDINQEAI